MNNTRSVRLQRVSLPALLASVCLVALLVLMGGTSDAAPPDGKQREPDPDIRIITVTASLSTSVFPLGATVPMTVSYDDTGRGVITLTFDITGTAPLTLTADAAFGGKAKPITFAMLSSPWYPVITYSVAPRSEWKGSVGYVVTNATMATDTASIVFVPQTTRINLPIVLRDYRPLTNGDFEQGEIGWTPGSGDFDGHGSGLPAAVLLFEGSQVARLGDPGARDGEIGVGYGVFSQKFTVDERYLHIRYRVRTYDIVKYQDRYFDTFEVSLNRPPKDITSDERDDKQCATTNLNPTWTITPTEGLAFCGGRDGSPPDAGTLDDSGWNTATLNLQNFRGRNVTLYLALWSREYEAPDYDDQGWYNTWAYVDYVELSDTP